MSNCPYCGADEKLSVSSVEIARLQAELETSAREESAALTQVERYSVENGRLQDEINCLNADLEHEKAWFDRRTKETAEVSAERDQMAAEIERLKAELAEARKDLEACRHEVPQPFPTNSLEAIEWIEQDRGYGMWSSADSGRFDDACKLVRDALQRPLGDPEIGLEIARMDLADARKAAQSLYAAMMHDDLDRAEIAEASLAKWPWLRPAEPECAPKYCSVVTRREVICGHPLPCPHHLAAAKQYTAGVRPEGPENQDSDGAMFSMVVSHIRIIAEEPCDKCGREFVSPPREDHPEGILWCAECAAKEMEV